MGRFDVWNGRPSNTFCAHEVAVGLRCENANSKTPRSFARLDPAFARDNSGRSVLFSIKEESTRLATSSPFSKRHNGKELLRVKPLLPPARAPLQKKEGSKAVLEFGPAMSPSRNTRPREHDVNPNPWYLASGLLRSLAEKRENPL